MQLHLQQAKVIAIGTHKWIAQRFLTINQDLKIVLYDQ